MIWQFILWLINPQKDVLGSGYSYFWGRYGGRYPVYVANMSTVYDDTNKYSGQFLVDFKNILMYLHMNLTDGEYTASYWSYESNNITYGMKLSDDYTVFFEFLLENYTYINRRN